MNRPDPEDSPPSPPTPETPPRAEAVRLFPDKPCAGGKQEGKKTLYHYFEDGEAVGPFPLETLLEMVRRQILDKNVRVRVDGNDDWSPLNCLVEIAPEHGEVPASVPPPEAEEARLETPSPKAHPPKAHAVPRAGDEPEEGIFGECLKLLDWITNLPRLPRPPFKRVYKAIFSLHKEAEAEAAISGEKAGVDHPTPLPWLFSRVLAYGLLAGFTLLWGVVAYESGIGAPGALFFFCTTVPVATLTVLIELCGLAHVSAYRMMKTFLIGGVLSIGISLFFYDLTVIKAVASLLSAMIAGPVEELAKLLAAVFISRSWFHNTRIRDGLLVGAAVGTGFAVFETAGYMWESLILMDYETFWGITFLRAFLSPFGHGVWTAIAAAALWRVAEGKRPWFNHMLQGSFLRIFALVVVLHMIWNGGFSLPFLGTFGIYLLVGFIGWYVLLQLYLEGRRQERETVAWSPTEAHASGQVVSSNVVG